ncbi:MAG: hypothetical protein FWD75_04380 [Propionibacteriaceae bacterium]|nr:hypothetical protein [Propionibacteriaceae bacterium]
MAPYPDDMPGTPTPVIMPLDPDAAAPESTAPDTTRPVASAQRPKRHHGVVVVVAVVVLLILGALGWYLAPTFLGAHEQPGTASSPTSAVQKYLDALASGDAATALLFSTSQPMDTTFASNDFLSAAMAANPLTDIQVPGGQTTSSPAVIQATYTLGGQPVEAHFTVQKYGRNWRLDSGFLPVDLSALVAKGVPLTLDGADLGAITSLSLLPGVYTLGTGDIMLALTAPTLTIDYPESNPTFSEGFTLSDEAVSRIQSAAQDHLTTCLAQKELAPAGCGFGFAGTSDGATIDPATLTWTLAADAPAITTIAPQLDGPSLTQAVAEISITVKFHGVSTDQRHLYNSTSAISAVRADFTNPDQIAITFG